METRFSPIHSKISGFSPVINPTDQVFSVGNLTRTTSLNEFVSFKVIATWFVILDNEFRRGILEMIGLNQSFNFLPILFWFIINPINHTILHNIRNPRIFTTISGSPRASHMDWGNREVIRPTQPRIRSPNHTIMAINTRIGSSVIIPVNRLLLFFFFIILFVLKGCTFSIFFLWRNTICCYSKSLLILVNTNLQKYILKFNY